MLRTITLIALLLCAGLHTAAVKASPVDTATARAAATRWLAARPAAKSVRHEAVRLEAGYPLAYLFSRGSEFVLIATDTACPEVLGYGSSPEGGTACPKALSAALQAAPKAQAYPPKDASWQAVEPLLTTTHRQGSPYNSLCPYYTYDDGTQSTERCLVGCVATAMEQVLTYHRLTYTLSDTLHGYATDHYRTDDILPGQSVNTALILDDYDTQSATAEQEKAVATLSYWLGVAAQMQYGTDASGANSQNLVEPLRRAFSLPAVHYLDSYLYAPADYWNYLAREIQQHRPVYYAGYTTAGNGHAFVIDGMDTDGLYHVQWGDDAQMDGYFRLDVLFALQTAFDRLCNYNENGYFCAQEAISVDPYDAGDNPLPDTLSLSGEEIEVERLWWGEEPVSNCFTPLYAALRNTSAHDLNTTFYVLMNSPADTALIDQARLLALSNRIIPAGGRDTLCIPVTLIESGSKIISVTADAEHLLGSLATKVRKGGEPAVASETPLVSYPTPTTARITQTLVNPSATERAAHYFGYDLLDNRTGRYEQIFHYVYLKPGESLTETVDFPDLTPGGEYTFRLRRYWGIQQSLSFTMPKMDAVEGIHSEETAAPVRWYDTDGRSTSCPTRPGVYLRTQGGHTVKRVIRQR